MRAPRRVAMVAERRAKAGRSSTRSRPVSKLALGDFVGSRITDIVRATGSEWQVSESGTSTWRTLSRTRNAVSDAAVRRFRRRRQDRRLLRRRHAVDDRPELFARVIRRHYTQPYKLNELRFGNFVGDSKVDVLRSTGNEWLVWDRVSKELESPQLVADPDGGLTFADFDGDGFTDIARSADGQWFVSWGGKSAWKVLNTADLDLKSQLIADFNGDRKADVLSRQSPD